MHEPQQNSSEDSIQVLIRIKPASQDQQSMLIHTHNEVRLDKHSFAFDRIFPPTSRQEDIFHSVGKKTIDHTLDGYNGCIFAYGQTGSGKTYTMMGDGNGLMQKSFHELFHKINKLEKEDAIITCSYYEIYNQQIIDLLDCRKDKKILSIRQDVKKGMFVENLTEEVIFNSDKLMQCLQCGMRNRHIGQTLMNCESSRSHSIFTISLAIKTEVNGKKVLKTPKLHFVDLAGSQRQKMTNATGERLKEAGNINKSLTSLGMVINALASEKPRTHIPYRDSKLTCLLKDSLGGNSKTFIIATVSQSILCFQQTLSTLNFANRAKMVKVKALINEESLSTNLEYFKDEIRRLKQQIVRLKIEKKPSSQSHNNEGYESIMSKNSNQMNSRFEELSTKICSMSVDLKSTVMTPAVQNLMNLLENRLKNGTQMKDESSEDQNNQNKIEEEGNQLIDYMSSNHQLLKNILQKLHDYREMKDHIKVMEFNKKMNKDESKTPSKFEREQYENLLAKREEQIKQLEEKIESIHEQKVKRELENRQLKRNNKIKVSKIQQNSEIEKMKSEIDSFYENKILMESKVEKMNQERKRQTKNIVQLEERIKQVKEIYLYAQEKYQNQKFLKAKVEQNLKDVNKRNYELETQKQRILDDLESKTDEFKLRVQNNQEKEEELKNQIEVLNETLEFNKKVIRDYNQKIQQNNRQYHEKINQNSEIQRQNQFMKMEFEKCQAESKNKIKKLEDSNQELEIYSRALRQQTQKNSEVYEQLKSQYINFKTRSQKKIAEIEQKYKKECESSIEYRTESERKNVEQMKILNEFQTKCLKYESLLECITEQKQLLIQQKTSIEQSLIRSQQNMNKERQSYQEKLNNISSQLQIVQEKYSKSEQQKQKFIAIVNSQKNLASEHQELKTSYKQTIKENYKLKGQYANKTNSVKTEAARNDQLISKVAFYEEKFKLMSLEYNKAQQATKRLKQKELNLAKKLEFFEQAEKMKKIMKNDQMNTNQVQNTVKQLKQQNKQLKEQLSKSTKINANNNQNKEDYSKRINLENQKYELELKQEKIKKRLQTVIKNWDHAKENNCNGMTIDQLFSNWERVQLENRKKFDGVIKGIKKQQKIKSQNHFIMKQNFYLHQKIVSLQKQVLGKPRKLLKTESVAQQ